MLDESITTIYLKSRVPSGSMQTHLYRVCSLGMLLHVCSIEQEVKEVNDRLHGLKDTLHIVLETRPMLFFHPNSVRTWL